MKNTKLKTPGLMVNGKFYRVMDFPRERVEKEGPGCLVRAVAYRIKTQLTDGLFPYRGIIDSLPLTAKNSDVGIYFHKKKNGKYAMLVRYPMNKRERELYSAKNEMDVAVAFLNRTLSIDQLTNIAASVGMEGKAFRPPISMEDDMLNKIMKLGIRLKNAPFEPYGKMLEQSVGNTKTAEGTNIRNNTRRMLYSNHAMSSSKFALCADTWQMDAAVILKDAPGAMNPMLPDGKMLILYPNGYKFEIDPKKLVDAEEMVEAAIMESAVDEDLAALEKEKAERETQEDIYKDIAYDDE